MGIISKKCSVSFWAQNIKKLLSAEQFFYSLSINVAGAKSETFAQHSKTIYRTLRRAGILSLLLTIYACRKDLIKHTTMFYDSKIGKNISKVVVTSALIPFIFIHLSIFVLTLDKYNFSVNGFYIASVITTVSLIITAGYFYFIFKDLFWPKNKTNQKPFTIVKNTKNSHSLASFFILCRYTLRVGFSRTIVVKPQQSYVT